MPRLDERHFVIGPDLLNAVVVALGSLALLVLLLGLSAQGRGARVALWRRCLSGSISAFSCFHPKKQAKLLLRNGEKWYGVGLSAIWRFKIREFIFK